MRIDKRDDSPSVACNKAMETNDKPDIEDNLREDLLRVIFSKNGDELEFIN